MGLETPYRLLAFVLGLIFGSFLNVCIYRLPRGLSVVRPRSACPQCGTPIAAYDNIPVFGWLLLRGRCRHCRARITPRYMVVELALGALFLACYGMFGPSLESFKWASFCFLILGLIFTDAETHLLPDLMTLPGLALGLLWSLFLAVPGPLLTRYGENGTPHTGLLLGTGAGWLSLADAVIGAAIGAGFIWASGALYLRWRGIEGMGFGDVKLMALVGAFLGPALTVFVLITASVAGGVYGLWVVLVVFGKRWRRYKAAARAWQSASLALRGHEMPFGVFLGSGALIALFSGERILAWYLSLF